MQGESVLVTGAARGLGRAIAADLAAAGARVWLADVAAEPLAATVAELQADGYDVRAAVVDVADEDSVQRLAHTVGPVYAVVNNAARADGVGGKAVHEITPDEWDSVIGVNLRGPWLVSRAFVPSMIATGRGRIVNLGSDAALFGSPRLAHYIASKGGVAALTRAMARDLGEHGVTVNTVAPGLTRTEGAAAIPAERHQLYADLRALSRPQEPSDVVGLVRFLLGAEAGYVTGQLLVVNGGFVFN